MKAIEAIIVIVLSWPLWAQQESPKNDPVKPDPSKQDAVKQDPAKPAQDKDPAKNGQDAPKREDTIQKDIDEAIKKLASDKFVESEEARAELLELGRRTVPALIKALNSEKPAVRRTVCDLLGELRDPEAVPALMHRLLDSEEYGSSIASAAARALGLIGDARAIPELVKLLDRTQVRTDKDLRYEVIRSLGILRAREAVEPLKKFLDDYEKTPFSQMIIGCAAIEALAKIRAKEAVHAIAKQLDTKTPETNTGMTVELYAARALERITGVSHGPLFDPNDEKTKEALKNWNDWWKTEKGKIDLEENKPKIEATRTSIAQVVTTLDMFKIDHNVYPKRLEDLVTMPDYAKKDKWPPGGYFKSVPKDGWDRPLVYRIPGTSGQPYDVVSHGLDGKEGGTGADADLWDHERKIKKDEPPKKEGPGKQEPPKKEGQDGKK